MEFLVFFVFALRFLGRNASVIPPRARACVCLRLRAPKPSLLDGWHAGLCRHPEDSVVVLRAASDFVVTGENQTMSELIYGPQHSQGVPFAIRAIQTVGRSVLNEMLRNA